MIFLTVGTLFPFDRLVKSVSMAIDSGIIKEKVIAQTGESKLSPVNMECIKCLDKEDFNKIIQEANYIISHAGVGSIVACLEQNKPLLVMPRQKQFQEHVNDHQYDIARQFEKLGHILVAYNEREIPEKIQQLQHFIPVPRHPKPNTVVERISIYLDYLNK